MSHAPNEVYQAISDPTRRLLLRKLREREGRTLGEMADGLGISRFGVMKHLAVLEEAGLIKTQRAGRLKLHYLETAPLAAVITEIRYLFPSPAKEEAVGAPVDGTG